MLLKPQVFKLQACRQALEELAIMNLSPTEDGGGDEHTADDAMEMVAEHVKV